MHWLAQLEYEKFLLFTLIFSRVSAMVMTAPIFSATEMPMLFRGLLAMVISVVVTPVLWTTPLPMPANLAGYLILVAGELMIGVALGMGMAILFAGLDVAGHVIGQSGGLLMAEVYDPSQGDNVVVFSRLLKMVTLATFACIGGHRILLAALLDTFAVIRPGAGSMPVSVAETLTLLISQSFHLGIRAAAPVLVALLLGNVVLALVGRTVPQLNVMIVGFGLNAMLMFGTLWLTFGTAVLVFQEQIEPTLEVLVEVITGHG